MVFIVTEGALDVIVEKEPISAVVSNTYVPDTFKVANPSCTIDEYSFIFCVHHHVYTCRMFIDQKRPIIPNESIIFPCLHRRPWGLRCGLEMKSVRYFGKQREHNVCHLCSLLVQPFLYFE